MEYQAKIISHLLKRKKYFFVRETEDPLHEAFDKKYVIHPMAMGKPIFTGIDKRWNSILSKKANNKKRAVYLHIPFCQTHCLFCGFYLNPFKKDEADIYTNYIIKELEMVKDSPFINSTPISAVYLGGGTPTALSSKNLSKLLNSIHKCLPLADNCEITVEGRIFNFSDDKIKACIEAGVNRFSLGIQSFDTKVRQKMGRINKKEEIIERLNFIKKFNAAVIIDLIYGLPYQTMEIWENDLKQSVELELDGLDLYQLNIYKGGNLEKALNKGLIDKPANIRVQADMFIKGVEYMKNANYKRLSITHWAKTDKERNIYNTLATSGRVCIPFGSGAGGWAEGYMFFLDNSLKGYYKKIDNKKKPIAFLMKQHENNNLFKDLVGQLEQGYCNLNELGKTHGLNLKEILHPLLKQWEKIKLIEIKDGQVKLTLAGEFWYTNICQAIIDYIIETKRH